MTRNAGKRKQSGSRARLVVDDSPKAIQARLDTFVERTRGCGGCGPRTHRCLRTLLYLPGLRGKDTIDEGPR
jgi:hypothetical protein